MGGAQRRGPADVGDIDVKTRRRSKEVRIQIAAMRRTGLTDAQTHRGVCVAQVGDVAAERRETVLHLGRGRLPPRPGERAVDRHQTDQGA